MARQDRLIRDFCQQEGVSRVEDMAGALIAEADRLSAQGDHARALESLALAGALDPGRPQIDAARARVLWNSGRRLGAAAELGGAFTGALARSATDFTLFNRLSLVLVLAAMLAVPVFAVLMLMRYQVAFRHEIEEWVVTFLGDTWVRPAGWAALLLPLLVWVAAGWAAIYWIVITFRFMRRAERVAAIVLLAMCAAAVPAWRMAAAIYSTTADPAVRTTLASMRGGYDPDRVVELQQLVRSYPDDPVYRFLLAGLYKEGRYFEEAFDEYKRALALDPGLYQAWINVGNIFHMTGQYDEAIANYNRALEQRPDALLAWYNMHLSQSEAFRFKDAEESLGMARRLDSSGLAHLLAGARETTGVLDARLETTSVWGAALAGRDPGAVLSGDPAAGAGWLPRQFLNMVTLLSALALLGCGVAAFTSAHGEVARRCIRCGRPFCHFCKSSRQGREYCSQCLHLYVLGDGLAPETKTRKLYEVARHERLTRLGRRLVSLVLPGAAQVLRGAPGRGVALLVLWLGALVAAVPLVLPPLEAALGVDLPLDLVSSAPVPAMHGVNAAAGLAVVGLLVAWIVGNAWHLRGREA